LETTTAIRDRTGWLAGPWDAEPEDRIAWRDEDTGLPCVLLRNHMGSWCGYVAVPPGHPWHGAKLSEYPEGVAYPKVHGGITYSNRSREHVCLGSTPDDSDGLWWVGFDAGHAYDLVPGFARLRSSKGDVYRNIGYMRAEVQTLARQAKACAA
jgi:hypothetical protein